MQRRNLEAYALAAAAFVCAVVTAVDDVLSENLRWAVVLGGIALLVYRLTLPPERLDRDAVRPADRLSFEGEPLSQLFGKAKDVRIYAPTGVNLLSAQNCQMLWNGLLAKRGGSLQVIVLDPEAAEGLRLAEAQLDGSEEHQVQGLREGLAGTLGRLERMRDPDRVAYRLLGFNPGFSLVLIDPRTRHGRVIVEFHGVRNESIVARMHLELTKEAHPRWFAYWFRQFERLWELARTPDQPV
ncbi:hypothetical protein [Nonomuraea sp. NPDC050310]|uniref:hypothetical protein n=1 Tax=unclassified Nonomuraea TaxID=2593643 RepID=UPI0033F97278